MVLTRDTTIQRMTIRQILIERLYKVSFSFEWLNHKISQTKKAKLGYIEKAIGQFKLFFTDLEQVRGQEKFL